MEEIHLLCDQIRQKLINLGMNDYVLYAEDYWGDMDEQDIDVSEYISDPAGSLDWRFNIQESVDLFSARYLYARKISIKGDGIVFELEEIYEDDKDNYESLKTYEGLTIDDILKTCPEKYVENCLKGILEYAFENDYYKVIELNRLRLQL